MRTSIASYRGNLSGGYALLIVLAIGAVSAVILAASLTHTINTATLNERNNQSVINVNAAEAAVEKVVARMMTDLRTGGVDAVNNNLAAYCETFPTEDEDPYWGQFEFSDGDGNVGQTYVTVISNETYVDLESQYKGLKGWVTTYRVLSNARQTTGRFSAHINAAQQEIQVASIPLFQFAFFYNGLMEFTAARNLTNNARVHANGDIFFTSAGPITFNAPVTATGTIQKKDVWGTIGSGNGPTTFNGIPDYRTNVTQLPFLLGVDNTSSNLHKIIELPSESEAVDTWPGRERFYHKAGITMLVSELEAGNTVVTLTVKNSPTDHDPAPFSWTNAMPDFVATTNVFRDRREGKWMKTTQIDITKLGQYMTNAESTVIAKLNANPLNNVLYVADVRPTNDDTNTAVRLVNGGALSSGWNNGLTVATPNPLYIKGNYNNTSTVPASVVCDALTILSSRWNDTDSNAPTLPVARSTTVNAAIITGSVPSQGATGNFPFSGGVMNLPRLLEDWRDRRLIFNTSIVNLFNSTKAVAPFSSSVYRPPRFHIFDFDPAFADPDKMPPATPMLSVLLRARWTSPAPNSISMAAEEE